MEVTIINLTLQDFTNMALDDYYDCCIWDNRKEENVFIGIIRDIPEELLNENFFHGKFKKEKY